MKKVLLAALLTVTCFFNAKRAHSFTDGSGWVQVSYLSKILIENYRRYQQLRLMFESIRHQKRLLDQVNAGINHARDLLQSMPIEDDGLLKELRSIEQGIETINKIYGKIPKSPDELKHTLHDSTVAESLRMVNDFKEYSREQEENAQIIAAQVNLSSPKGAAKLSAQSNAMILNSLSQLIRLQTQTLKLQSEAMAFKNSHEKDEVRGAALANESAIRSAQELRPSTTFLKFKDR